MLNVDDVIEFLQQKQVGLTEVCGLEFIFHTKEVDINQLTNMIHIISLFSSTICEIIVTIHNSITPLSLLSLPLP